MPLRQTTIWLSDNRIGWGARIDGLQHDIDQKNKQAEHPSLDGNKESNMPPFQKQPQRRPCPCLAYHRHHIDGIAVDLHMITHFNGIPSENRHRSDQSRKRTAAHPDLFSRSRWHTRSPSTENRSTKNTCAILLLSDVLAVCRPSHPFTKRTEFG